MFRRIIPLITVLLLFVACKKEKAYKPAEDIPTNKYYYKTLNTNIDSLQYNHPLLLDLNADEVIDFYLSSVLLENNDRPYLYLFINRKTPNQNKIIVRPGEELPLNALWAIPLEKNFKIWENASADAQWSDDQQKTALLNVTDDGSIRTFGGEWIGKKDKYLGLKFKIAGKYHYGWLRISHKANEAKLAILDYAYNKEPETSILAGQTQ